MKTTIINRTLFGFLVLTLVSILMVSCEQENVKPNNGGVQIIIPLYATPVEGKIYTLKNRGSGRTMDVADKSNANGANIQQWGTNANTTGTHRQWEVIATDGDYVRLKGVDSGKCLEVSAGSNSNGANIQQWTYKGTTHQQWQIIATSDGYCRLKSRDSGKTLEIGGYSTTNGGNAQQWAYKGYGSQQWYFTELGSSDTETGGSSYSNPGEIPKFQDALGDAKLQAPTSTTIATSSELLAGYSSSIFQVVNDDEIVFYQTGDSKRTELRFEDNYDLTSGSRTAHANLKIISQAGDESTFMQIHDDANAGDGPNKPLLRMYRLESTNRLYAAVKTDDGGSNTTHLDCGAAPSGYFDCDITLNAGKMTIKIDGSTKVSDRDVSFWDYPSYWKAGVYNQDDGGTTIYFNELTW